MEWRHQTWQCARCRFKLGCCEGADPAGDPYDAAATASSSTQSRVRKSQNASPAYGP